MSKFLQDNPWGDWGAHFSAFLQLPKSRLVTFSFSNCPGNLTHPGLSHPETEPHQLIHLSLSLESRKDVRRHTYQMVCAGYLLCLRRSAGQWAAWDFVVRASNRKKYMLSSALKFCITRYTVLKVI